MVSIRFKVYFKRGDDRKILLTLVRYRTRHIDILWHTLEIHYFFNPTVLYMCLQRENFSIRNTAIKSSNTTILVLRVTFVCHHVNFLKSQLLLLVVCYTLLRFTLCNRQTQWFELLVSSTFLHSLLKCVEMNEPLSIIVTTVISKWIVVFIYATYSFMLLVENFVLFEYAFSFAYLERLKMTQFYT